MFTISELIEVTGGKPSPLLEPEKKATSVSTDTRTLEKGSVFFALKGDHYDGNTFIPEAIEKGAICAIGSKPVPYPTITVDNTVKALGDVAAYWRSKFDICVIGITGTNGKTTTKNIVSSLLSLKFSVLKTEGNYNNLIGLPLTLFRLNRNHEICVLEMGMSRRGEIQRLCEISNPEIGIITNVSEAHLEYLHTLENIVEAKAELLEYLGPDDIAIVNGDNPLLTERIRNTKPHVFTFGESEGVSSQVSKIECSTQGCTFQADDNQFNVPLLGIHNVINTLAALICTQYLGLSTDEQKKGLLSIEREPMRTEIVELDNVIIVNDAYNANPASVISTLRTLSLFRAKRKIAVLGDMYELGDSAENLHEEVGRKTQLFSDVSIFVGKLAEYYKQGNPEGIFFETKKEAIEFLEPFLKDGDVVLIKGSRATRMEEVVDALVQNISTGGNRKYEKKV